MDQTWLVFAIVGLPVISACLGLTVHFAIRPMVDSLIEAIRELRSWSGERDGAARSPLLEEEVRELRDEVRRLREQLSFDARLTAGRADPDGPPRELERSRP